ncbi:MAG: hypothetical protein ACOY81_12170 [Bacillota bacterium]
MNVRQARAAVEEFFCTDLGYTRHAVQVLGVQRLAAGWRARVMVTETNRYLKHLGYPPVYDRNYYLVELDDALEITSYWPEGTGEGNEGIGTY